MEGFYLCERWCGAFAVASLLALPHLGVLLNKLTVGSHGVVDDGLERRTAEVSDHGLEGRASVLLLHLKVFLTKNS